jgi:hypothetical protein
MVCYVTIYSFSVLGKSGAVWKPTFEDQNSCNFSYEVVLNELSETCRLWLVRRELRKNDVTL